MSDVLREEMRKETHIIDVRLRVFVCAAALIEHDVLIAALAKCRCLVDFHCRITFIEHPQNDWRY